MYNNITFQIQNERSLNLRKTVIEPNGKNFQYWKDIWNYRELAFNLAKRDITVRYKQTKIGLGWAIISPIVNMVITTFVFGTLAGLESDGSAPYFIMVYAGSIPWGLVSSSVNVGAGTFISNAGIMNKVYFPRILAPIGAIMAKLVDSLVSMGIMLILMVVSGYFPSWKMLLFPLFMILCVLLGMCAGLFLSAFNVKWRDLQQGIPFLINVVHYLTPVMYSINSIPEKYRLLYSLNPATGIVQAFKWCIIKDIPFDFTSFFIALAWIAVLIPLGIYNFRKTERTFVDIV